MSLRRLLAAFLLGTLLGAAAAAGGAARTVERLRLSRDRAEQELGQARQELNQLKAQPGEQGPRVTAIEVLVDHPDPRVLLEVERRLEKQLAPLRGRRVDSLDSHTFYASIQGQLVEVDGVIYRLRVLAIAVFPRLLLHVQAEEPPAARRELMHADL